MKMIQPHNRNLKRKNVFDLRMKNKPLIHVYSQNKIYIVLCLHILDLSHHET